jgi:hypothetical protein
VEGVQMLNICFATTSGFVVGIRENKGISFTGVNQQELESDYPLSKIVHASMQWRLGIGAIYIKTILKFGLFAEMTMLKSQ